MTWDDSDEKAPFFISKLTPISSRRSISTSTDALRGEFTTDEWID